MTYMNEHRQTDRLKVSKSAKATFLLSIPEELLDYYRNLAEKEGRFISAQMVIALEASRAARDSSLSDTDTEYIRLKSEGPVGIIE